MTQPIVRRLFQLLPFLLWAIVTAAPAERAPGFPDVTNIFAPESTAARVVFEDSLAVFGLTGVIFVMLGSLLVYAVVKFRITAESAVSGRRR